MRRIALLTLLAPALLADGGQVILRGTDGPFEITVFASPAPLAAGPVDLSVLVQSPAPVLDASVHITLLQEARRIELEAAHAYANNKLLYAVPAEIPASGPWTAVVQVSRGGQSTQIRGTLRVAPRPADVPQFLSLFLIPPVALALFAMNQRLRRRRGNPVATSRVRMTPSDQA